MDALNGVARDGNSASLVVGEVAHTAQRRQFDLTAKRTKETK